MDKTINYADLIGVQFKNRGRDITSGVDCYGLVMEVYRRFGIDLPEFTADFDDVEKINSLICTEAVKTSVWREVSKGEISAPCIIAIRFGARLESSIIQDVISVTANLSISGKI